jgi:phosphoglycolate phosphatase-like HAD superfamily hydrolase
MTGAEAVGAARLVVWDFDGVIKDSLDVKTRAFVRLFEPYGTAVAEQVRRHHEANGGTSRFEKIPLYLRCAGEEPTDRRVGELCDAFGALVRQAVIDAPWVAGAETYLRTNPRRQLFVLVSATPHGELMSILEALDLHRCFAEVFGAPTRKAEAIRQALTRLGVEAWESVMIGDASADMEAALACDVPFVLRRHASNASGFASYTGPSIEDLAHV